MLALIAVQASLGLFSDDDILFEGPLAPLVSDAVSKTATSLHHILFNVLLSLVILHVLVIASYWLFLRKNLLFSHDYRPCRG